MLILYQVSFHERRSLSFHHYYARPHAARPFLFYTESGRLEKWWSAKFSTVWYAKFVSVFWKFVRRNFFRCWLFVLSCVELAYAQFSYWRFESKLLLDLLHFTLVSLKRANVQIWDFSIAAAVWCDCGGDFRYCGAVQCSAADKIRNWRGAMVYSYGAMGKIEFRCGG